MVSLAECVTMLPTPASVYVVYMRGPSRHAHSLQSFMIALMGAERTHEVKIAFLFISAFASRREECCSLVVVDHGSHPARKG